MPAKKPPAKAPPTPPEPPWQVVLERLDTVKSALEERIEHGIESTRALEERIERGIESTRAIVEDIRSDNRTTIETLHGVETRLDAKIDEGLANVTARLDVVEAVVRQNSAGIREITAKVDELTGLEKRVAGLERRTG